MTQEAAAELRGINVRRAQMEFKRAAGSTPHSWLGLQPYADFAGGDIGLL